MARNLRSHFFINTIVIPSIYFQLSLTPEVRRASWRPNKPSERVAQDIRLPLIQSELLAFLNLNSQPPFNTSKVTLALCLPKPLSSEWQVILNKPVSLLQLTSRKPKRQLLLHYPISKTSLFQSHYSISCKAPLNSSTPHLHPLPYSSGSRPPRPPHHVRAPHYHPKIDFVAHRKIQSKIRPFSEQMGQFTWHTNIPPAILNVMGHSPWFQKS